MEDTIAAWLNQQDNVITRMQALEVMSLETLRHRLGRRWQILLPGVYVATTGTPTDRQRLRAAILYGGDSAQLCDTTALLAYRVRYVPADPEIRLLLVRARPPSQPRRRCGSSDTPFATTTPARRASPLPA